MILRGPKGLQRSQMSKGDSKKGLRMYTRCLRKPMECLVDIKGSDWDQRYSNGIQETRDS